MARDSLTRVEVLAAVACLFVCASGYWTPRASDRLSFQYQLSDAVNSSFAVDVYDIDMFDNTEVMITGLHGLGRKVICYVNCGAWENWRPDAGSFPPSIIGNPLDGWPGEKWLDVRSTLLQPILEARFDEAASKGCDAVECDNVDGYTQDSGFPISSSDQISFNTWFADAVHARGMAVGLKNDVDQLDALASSFDFAINEQCHQYDECDTYASTFLAQDKSVFGVEYSISVSTFCEASNAMNMSFIKKSLDLVACPLYECKFLCDGCADPNCLHQGAAAGTSTTGEDVNTGSAQSIEWHLTDALD